MKFLAHPIRHTAVLATAAALAGAAQAATFSSAIELQALNGTQTAGGYVTSNNTLDRTLVSAANAGLKGSTSVDLGVLKAAAAVPAWNGEQATPYTSYRSSATTSYTDTLTFNRVGGGMVDVSFSFAFDGSVLDPNAATARHGVIDLHMTLAGATGSVTASGPRDYYFRDGVRDTYYDAFLSYAPCRTGQAGQAALICEQRDSFTFSSGGDKTGTATLSFSVMSGQAISVTSEMRALIYSDPYIREAASYDFSHTATLTRIATPAGTTITSALVVSLTTTDGGVTYAPAIAAAVPEPGTNTMLLAGLGLLGWLARRHRDVRVNRPATSKGHS